MTSILEKARNEGRDKAEARCKSNMDQMSLMNHDDAYYRGQQDGWEDAPSRFKWWAFGVLVGVAISFAAGSFA